MCWCTAGSCSKPLSKLVRVVTAPVLLQSKRACKSSCVVAHGLAEFTKGGSIDGSGMAMMGNRVDKNRNFVRVGLFK